MDILLKHERLFSKYLIHIWRYGDGSNYQDIEKENPPDYQKSYILKLIKIPNIFINKNLASIYEDLDVIIQNLKDLGIEYEMVNLIDQYNMSLQIVDIIKYDYDKRLKMLSDLEIIYNKLRVNYLETILRLPEIRKEYDSQKSLLYAQAKCESEYYNNILNKLDDLRDFQHIFVQELYLKIKNKLITDSKFEDKKLVNSLKSLLNCLKEIKLFEWSKFEPKYVTSDKIFVPSIENCISKIDEKKINLFNHLKHNLFSDVPKLTSYYDSFEETQEDKTVDQNLLAMDIKHITDSSISLDKEIEKYAGLNVTLLITGESGVGKEFVARKIHNLKNNSEKNFFSINCTAIQDQLLESELFGYEKGAFTGANNTKKGYFELADIGTIFLDEIGDASHNLQSKLLRVIETKEFLPVGGTKHKHFKARVILATNKKLKEEVEKKIFREDLYYRISTHHIRVKPLRDRMDEVKELISNCIEKFNKNHNKKFIGIQDEAFNLLSKYHWPGNIRQLNNEIEYALISSKNNKITISDFSPKLIREIREVRVINPIENSTITQDYVKKFQENFDLEVRGSILYNYISSIIDKLIDASEDYSFYLKSENIGNEFKVSKDVILRAKNKNPKIIFAKLINNKIKEVKKGVKGTFLFIISKVDFI